MWREVCRDVTDCDACARDRTLGGRHERRRSRPARPRRRGGVARLLELQEPGGWWVGELESNVTITARASASFSSSCASATRRRRLGVMAELLAQQRPDGLWSIYHGGEPDLNATIEAYAALRLAGLSDRAPQLAEARRFCEERGGIGAARVFTRIWFVALRALVLGRGAPASGRARAAAILDCRSPSTRSRAGPARRCCRSRSSCTTGPFALLRGRAPGRELDLGPVERAATERLGRRRPPAQALRALARQARPRAGARRRRALDHRPPGARRRLGRHPAAVGLVADRARVPRPRARLPVRAARARTAGTASSSRTATACGPRRASRRSGTRASRCSALPRPASAQRPPGASPGRSPGSLRRGGARTRRLGASGFPGSSRAAGRSSTRTTSTRTSTTPPSSRSLSTSSASAGLRSSGPAAGSPGMQSANGGWGAFDVDNDAYWLYDIPFCDFGAVIDPPSVDVTAHVVELLARASPATSEAVRRGVDYLLARAGAATDPGGAAGASTTSTGRARRCRRSRPQAFAPDHPAVRRARRLARGAPERGRRLRRGLPLLRPRRGRAAPGAGAASRRRRRPPGR